MAEPARSNGDILGNVSHIAQRMRKSEPLGVGHDGRLEGGGGPPHNDDMETRVSKLESLAEATREKLAAMDTRLAVMDGRLASMDSAMATKADLHKEITAQTWKLVTWVSGLFVTVATALVGATYFLATHLT